MTVGGATYKGGKDDTFVTGGGLPGRGKTAKMGGECEESEEEPEFENLEDELLLKVNKHEEDFK
jgi:hypothetical protein